MVIMINYFLHLSSFLSFIFRTYVQWDYIVEVQVRAREYLKWKKKEEEAGI